MSENTEQERIKKYDQILFEFENKLKEIESLKLTLIAAQNTAIELSDYLQSENWMKDYDQFGHLPYPILGQDDLYNTLQDFEHEKIQILKFICNHLKG